MTTKEEVRIGILELTASECSLHGLNHVVSAKPAAFRIFWALLLIGVGVGFSFHLSSLITNYLHFDHYNRVTFDTDGELVFPQVTICDTEPISDFTVKRGDKRMLLQVFRQWQTVLKYAMTTERSKQQLIFETFSNLQALFGNVPQEILKLALQAEDLVLSCKFLNYHCNASDFQLYQHPSFLNCYIFKVPHHVDHFFRHASHKLVGPKNGLSLILTSNIMPNTFYIEHSHMQNTHSLKVSVTEPGTDPNILDTGIDIMPGVSTSFAISQIEHHRLKSPYANCSEKEQIRISDTVFNSSPNICRKKCLAMHILDACGCRSSGVDLFFNNLTGEKADYCLFWGNTDFGKHIERAFCEAAVFDNISKDPHYNLTRGCGCNWNCFELKYDISISQAQWPQKFTFADFHRRIIETSRSVNVRETNKILKRYYTEGSLRYPYETIKISSLISGIPLGKFDLTNPSVFEHFVENVTFVPDMNPNLLNLTSLHDAISAWITSDFYKLKIYYKTASVEKHHQVAAFGLVDLWSAVGGILGLWFGASLLTLIEASQLFATCASRLFVSRSNRKTRVQAKSAEAWTSTR